MVEYITTYYRDGEPISHEEWSKMLDNDIKEENKYSTWNIAGAVYTDIGNGRDIEVNGHEYIGRTSLLYDSAKELLNDLMWEGHYEGIFDVLKQMTEEEVFNIVSKIEYVNIQDGKLLLKDEEDWG